ncbi:MAG: GNAT family N-acetyltransferase [Desulfobacteraceae bacterium]|jgi:GNAT superfamily N-acetyltransferase
MNSVEQKETLIMRVALQSDLPDVLELYAQLGQDDGSILDMSEATRIFNIMKTYPDYRVYLAVLNEKAVGTFTLLIMDNIAHKGAKSAVLEDVVVSETMRGKGVGTLMMDYAGKLAKQKGCYKLSFSSNRNRTDAHRFYEKLGFERHGISFLIEL